MCFYIVGSLLFIVLLFINKHFHFDSVYSITKDISDGCSKENITISSLIVICFAVFLSWASVMGMVIIIIIDNIENNKYIENFFSKKLFPKKRD